VTKRSLLSFSAVAFAALLFTAALHAEPLSPLKLAAIAPRMQQFVDEGTVAGAVTVVGNANGIVHHEAIGYQNLESKQPLTKDALFRIASMTKPITAIGIMQLQEEGNFRLRIRSKSTCRNSKGRCSSRSARAITSRSPSRRGRSRFAIS
jgi:CubicO group peptidase (beta-lactamase class C family)